MGDLNLHVPHYDKEFTDFLNTKGYNIVPLHTNWTWQQTTADPYPIRTHIDYIITPINLQVIQAFATTNHPICTDHKLLILTFKLQQPVQM